MSILYVTLEMTLPLCEKLEKDCNGRFLADKIATGRVTSLPSHPCRKWTIYFATTILGKCRKVVLEKCFCKFGSFFSGQPLFSDLKKARFMV